MAFRNSLKQESSQRGWSQSETARRGRISQQTTSRVLNRQTQPTAVACRGIARALNMPLAEVLE
ncbi:MAG: helix-turn-helix transcriptional regulator, partial [Anaerolineae bacterium]|nr:helix-turn-helix transcriptional regulator [Anaerolineae bacterium]